MERKIGPLSVVCERDSEWAIEANSVSPIVADSLVECASVLVPAVTWDSALSGAGKN